MPDKQPLLGNAYGTVYNTLDNISYIFVFAAGWSLSEGLREYMNEKYADQYNKLEIGIFTMCILILVSIVVVYTIHVILSSDKMAVFRMKSQLNEEGRRSCAGIQYLNSNI